MSSQPLMILIAGPYRSGTNDDPVLIAANVRAMNEMALRVFRLGHLPVLGEWFALPSSNSPDHSASAMPSSMKSFIPLRGTWWRAAMPVCASAARHRARMKWSKWRARTVNSSFNVSKIFRPYIECGLFQRS